MASWKWSVKTARSKIAILKMAGSNSISVNIGTIRAVVVIAKVLTASCVELGGGETETGECSPEFDSSCSSPFNFRFSSKATRARQKLFSCSFIVERRGKRFPQYWQAKNSYYEIVRIRSVHDLDTDLVPVRNRWYEIRKNKITYQKVFHQCEHAHVPIHRFFG